MHHDEGTEQVSANLAADTARLLNEADTALSSSRWAVINNGTPSTRHRLYDAAALRHTCGLLRSISLSALDEDELGVRVLGRAHTEAWLTGIYLHFGGNDALQRIAADTKHETITTNNAIKHYDAELTRAKKKARNKLKAVREANAGITIWNERHPEESPKALLDEPYISQQSRAGIDLTTRIADFGEVQEQELSLSEVTEALTKLGPERGFARENFSQLYLYYRLMSSASIHPTLHLYDSYFEPPRGYFVHTTAQPTGNSAIIVTWGTALYATALHAGWVLHDADQPSPIANELRAHLEPDPASAGWSPGE
jgi:hypothetical protein